MLAIASGGVFIINVAQYTVNYIRVIVYKVGKALQNTKNVIVSALLLIYKDKSILHWISDVTQMNIKFITTKNFIYI